MAGGDGYTKALITVDYAHHEVHSGSHYFVREVVDQAITTVYDLQVTTPDTRRWAHVVWSVMAEDEVDFYIYEDVSIVLAGTTIPVHNSNRNSTKTSSLIIKGIVNGSVGDADADTATAAATQLEHMKAGANRTPMLSDRDHEIILKQNTNYCFRVVFTKAAYIAYDLNWYEHTNKTVDPTQWR